MSLWQHLWPPRPRRLERLSDILGAGSDELVMLAGSVVFGRVLVIVAITAPAHFLGISPWVASMLGVMLVLSAVLWWKVRGEKTELPPQSNPTELRSALVFTAIFAVVLLATAAAKDFFGDVKRNARVLASNKQVALAVAAGTVAFGLTDTDDAIIEVERGMPVAIVYPDQAEGQLGTLFIPKDCRFEKDKERWIGKIIKPGPAVTEVDDIQRNILSILRRVAPNARIPASAVKIFVLQGAIAAPAVIDDEAEGDEVESGGSSGPYIVPYDRYER